MHSFPFERKPPLALTPKPIRISGLSEKRKTKKEEKRTYVKLETKGPLERNSDSAQLANGRLLIQKE